MFYKWFKSTLNQRWPGKKRRGQYEAASRSSCNAASLRSQRSDLAFLCLAARRPPTRLANSELDGSQSDDNHGRRRRSIDGGSRAKRCPSRNYSGWDQGCSKDEPGLSPARSARAHRGPAHTRQIYALLHAPDLQGARVARRAQTLARPTHFHVSRTRPPCQGAPHAHRRFRAARCPLL